MASDNSGSGEGWRVDTINITWCLPPDSVYSHASPNAGIPTPVVDSTKSLRYARVHSCTSSNPVIADASEL
jgi:hypothetical protein